MLTKQSFLCDHCKYFVLLPIFPTSRQLEVDQLQNINQHWFRPLGLRGITVSLISNSPMLLINWGEWAMLAASPNSTDTWENHAKLYKYLLCTGKMYFLSCFCETVELRVLKLNNHIQFQRMWRKTQVVDIVFHSSGSSGPSIFPIIFPKSSILFLIVYPWMILHLLKPSITTSATGRLHAFGDPGAMH